MNPKNYGRTMFLISVFESHPPLFFDSDGRIVGKVTSQSFTWFSTSPVTGKFCCMSHLMSLNRGKLMRDPSRIPICKSRS